MSQRGRAAVGVIIVVALMATMAAEVPRVARALSANAAPGALSSDKPAPPPDTPGFGKLQDGPAPGQTAKAGPETGPSAEVTAHRGPHSSLYKLSNGQYREEFHTAQIHYRDGHGSWKDIDNSIVPDGGPAHYRNKTNGWTAHFAPTSEGVSLETPKGTITFRPVDAAAVDPQKGDDEGTVVYPEVWPHVDLKYVVSGDHVEEDIILKAPTDRSAFAFALGDPAGIATSTSGERFLAPQVLDKDGRVDSSAAPQLNVANGTATISVDPTWLAGLPADAFPVTVDPTTWTFDVDNEIAYPESGSPYAANRVGNTLSSGHTYWRSDVHFDYDEILGAHVTKAVMNLQQVGGTPNPHSVTVRTATGAGYYGAVGDAVATFSNFHSSGSFTAASQSDALIVVLNSLLSPSPAFGTSFKFFGDETNNSYTYQSLNATLDLTFDWPPIPPQASGPADGAVVSTLTPVLAVNPVYTAAGPESTYRFQVWNNSTGTGTPVWDMNGYGTPRYATVPNTANLRDGTTYSWRATAIDGTATSPGGLSTFRVDRRLGQDDTQANESFGPFSVNAGNGNVLFSTATPSVTTVAGPAAVSFAYNSSAVQVPGGVAPVLPGNWTMSAGDGGLGYVSARTEGTSVVLTDATGVLHTYTAKGNGGGYDPPKGELGVLTKNDDGTLTLQDEDGRTYTFDTSGILTGVTSAADDRKPAALGYTYDTGHPAMLKTVSDPARNNSSVLSMTYENGGTDVNGTCPSAPSGFDSSAPSGMLCQVTLIDGRKTNLFYASGWLARIDQVTTDGSGDVVWDFGYDSQGRVNSVRDPLNYDWVAGHASDDANQHWDLTYDNTANAPTYGRVLSITAPRPDPTVAARPKKTFTYRTGEDAALFQATGLGSGIDVAIGDVVGNDKANEIVVSSGSGNPIVRVYNATGATLLNSFTPYANTYQGPVRVTVGDVVASHPGSEIVTAANSDVRVFSNSPTLDGNGVAIPLAEIAVSGLHDGLDVAVGKVIPGEGNKIIVGSGAGTGATAEVRVYDPTSPYAQRSWFLAYGSPTAPFSGGVHVTTIDRDFDGTSEIVTGAGPGGGPHVRVLTNAGTELAGYYALDPDFTGGIDVGGDATSDALAVSTVSQNSVLLSPADGSYFRLPYIGSGFLGGSTVAMGDLDGFGSAQAITGAGPGGGPEVDRFAPKGVNDVNTDYGNGVRMSRRVDVDGTFRVTRDVDAAGTTTRTLWDPSVDRVNATFDAAGRKTTKVYDSHGWVTQAAGPDTANCFNADGTASCAATPKTTYGYDEGIAGLSATYWSNKTLTGAPTVHTTGVGTGDGSLNQTWSGSPATGVPADGWSARFAGEINFAQTGAYTLETTSDDGVRVFVDDQKVIDDWTVHAPTTTDATYTNATTGKHRIRVELFDENQSSQMTLRWIVPGGSAPAVVVPGSSLSPAYGLTTTTSTWKDATNRDDTTTSYSASGIDPALGVATSTTSGGLTTAKAYESPGTEFLRPVSMTLPGSGTTSYAYYADNATATNPCPAGGTINQGGAMSTKTGADPDNATGGAVPRVEDYVYDAAGRTLASVVHPQGSAPSASDWACTTYDDRGRVKTSTTPAFGTEAARTVTNAYSVGGDPRVSTVSDPAGTISTTTDLLGRTTSYTDVWGKTTTTSYDLAGRVTSTNGPQGLVETGYDDSGKPTSQKLDGATVATPTYNASGELTSVDYPAASAPAGVVFRAEAHAAETGQTTLVLNQPTGTQPNDVLVASVTTASAASVTAPSGWTVALNSANGTTVRTKVYWHVAASGDPASWTFNLGGAPDAAGVIAGYSGVDTSNPVDGSPAAATGNATTSHVAAAVTTTVANDKLVTLYGVTGSTTLTPQSGMTERADLASSGSTSVTTELSDQDLSATGSTGTRTATSAASATSAMVTFALKAASSGGGSTTAGNGTNGSIGRDAEGRTTSLAWNKTSGGSLITSDAVTYDRAGRVVDQSIDGVDPYSAGANFGYDSAGRLTTAHTATGHTLGYGFGTTSCGAGTNSAAGSNSNRTLLTDGASSTSYCYDYADRLVSTSDARYGSITYDAHGNTATIGDEVLTYDGADRHVATTVGTTTVRYVRDATDRIVARTVSGGGIAADGTATATATSGTLTINRPAGTQTGDVLVAVVTASGAASVTATADWANAANKADTANTVRTKVFTHVAAGTDPSSWAFTIGGTASAVGGIVAYSGVDTASPVDAAAVAQDSATTSHSAPSVTTTVAGDKLVAVYGLTANTTVTPAAGMADRADQGLAGTNPLTVAVDDVDVAAAGATPAKTATSAAAANAAIATVALKPAGGGSSTTIRYGFTGDGDTPDFTMNSAGGVIERDVALLGGVSVTKRSGGDVWSYPNIHGDTSAVADAAGTKNASTLTYDPFGQQLASLPDNSDGNYDYGWLGSKQRGLEHETDIATIEMGARQYVPGLGRFLQTDPIEGGSANNYDYAAQDPVNHFDLDGNCFGFCIPNPVRYAGWMARQMGRGLARVAKRGARYLSNPHTLINFATGAATGFVVTACIVSVECGLAMGAVALGHVYGASVLAHAAAGSHGSKALRKPIGTMVESAGCAAIFKTSCTRGLLRKASSGR